MATINVPTALNQEASQIASQLDAALQASACLQITDAEGYEIASQELVAVSEYGRRLEDQRLAITRPMDQAKAAVMDLFRPQQAKVATIVERLKAGILGYQRDLEAKRRAAEEAARRQAAEEAAAARAEADRIRREAEERTRQAEEAARKQREAQEQAAREAREAQERAAAAQRAQEEAARQAEAARTKRQRDAAAAAQEAARQAQERAEAEAAARQREAQEAQDRADQARREAQAQAEAEAEAEVQAADLEQEGEAVGSMPVPVTGLEAPKAAGVSIRKTWKAECFDLHALIKAAAAALERGDGSIAMLLAPDTRAIGERARALRQHMKVPGIRVQEVGGVAA